MSININQTTNTSFSSTGREINTVGSYTSTTDAMQTGTGMLYASGTIAGAVVMGWSPTNAINTTAPSSYFTLAANSVWYFKGTILANRGDYTDGSVSAQNAVAFDFSFMMARGATPNLTVFVGTPTKTKVFGANNTNINTSSIDFAVDTVNGHPIFLVSGETGVQYRWVANFTFTRLS